MNNLNKLRYAIGGWLEKRRWAKILLAIILASAIVLPIFWYNENRIARLNAEKQALEKK